ncbi:hypothetical protein DFJ74DRAFT_670156 [Hyaloraphidium curvatum]|nr:hypothetical protein DFJ74DRAFT_670156 [Hyaloraphidium curvatum]
MSQYFAGDFGSDDASADEDGREDPDRIDCGDDAGYSYEEPGADEPFDTEAFMREELRKRGKSPDDVPAFAVLVHPSSGDVFLGMQRQDYPDPDAAGPGKNAGSSSSSGAPEPVTEASRPWVPLLGCTCVEAPTKFIKGKGKDSFKSLKGLQTSARKDWERSNLEELRRVVAASPIRVTIPTDHLHYNKDPRIVGFRDEEGVQRWACLECDENVEFELKDHLVTNKTYLGHITDFHKEQGSLQQVPPPAMDKSGQQVGKPGKKRAKPQRSVKGKQTEEPLLHHSAGDENDVVVPDQAVSTAFGGFGSGGRPTDDLDAWAEPGSQGSTPMFPASSSYVSSTPEYCEARNVVSLPQPTSEQIIQREAEVLKRLTTMVLEDPCGVVDTPVGKAIETTFEGLLLTSGGLITREKPVDITDFAAEAVLSAPGSMYSVEQMEEIGNMIPSNLRSYFICKKCGKKAWTLLALKIDYCLKCIAEGAAALKLGAASDTVGASSTDQDGRASAEDPHVKAKLAQALGTFATLLGKTVEPFDRKPDASARNKRRVETSPDEENWDDLD